MSKEYQHNRGQEDASKGRFEPPLNQVTEIGSSEKQREDDKAYREGWRNTADQKKGD